MSNAAASASVSIDQWVFGGYRLSSRTRELIGPDQIPIPLRRQSFEVLSNLLEEANTVIPHAVLMEKVWGRTIVGRDSLTQCITEIRRRIRDDERKVVITVPRTGYRIVAQLEENADAVVSQGNRTTRFFWSAGLILCLLFGLHLARVQLMDQSASLSGISVITDPISEDAPEYTSESHWSAKGELLRNRHYPLLGFTAADPSNLFRGSEAFAEWRSGSIWAGVDPGIEDRAASPFVVVRHHMNIGSHMADWP